MIRLSLIILTVLFASVLYAEAAINVPIVGHSDKKIKSDGCVMSYTDYFDSKLYVIKTGPIEIFLR